MPASWAIYKIRFIENDGGPATVLMSFRDPFPCRAVVDVTGPDTVVPETQQANSLDVLTVPEPDNPGLIDGLVRWVNHSLSECAPAALTTKLHGVSLVWRPGRAAIQTAPDRMEAILAAVVEFSFYESQLRELERETADSWSQLELDSRLTCDIGNKDLKHARAIEQRVRQALLRRARLERLAPHLRRPTTFLASLASQLGERLREKLRTEDRIETLERQCDVFERIYDMTSQRLSETRIAAKANALEWAIIILLASETLLLLIEVLWTVDV
ncbi:MAG: hypothetical protein KatS3mg105_2483 [Gemmatales bacterium]|nr:MAG: hypothetical protein KatS3mg105_2483 [Gemmatales bacterium]